MNRRTLVLGVSGAALAGFGAAVFLANEIRKPKPVAAVAKDKPLIRPYSPTFGPADAPVTIVEFFDPACEACAAFHPIVKKIMNAFPGKVRLVMRYTAFHAPSAEAITVLETARLQNLFEPVLVELFKTQSSWAPHGREPVSGPWDIASKAGLDVKRARSDAKMPGVVAAIKQDAADVTSAGVQKTPTFFVNGKPLTKFGPQPLYDLVRSEVEATSASKG